MSLNTTEPIIAPVFSIYDSKAKAFTWPWKEKTNETAQRAFQTLVMDPSTTIAKAPADYTLFRIGDWNEDEGVFVMLDAKENLGNGLNFVQYEPTVLGMAHPETQD